MIPMTAQEFYIQGNQHRRNGDYQAAMNAYMEAIALDPESPGSKKITTFASTYKLILKINKTLWQKSREPS